MSNPQTLAFFRRLLKTGYKVFGEDKMIIDALRTEASKLG
jgi:hypothetical protein